MYWRIISCGCIALRTRCRCSIPCWHEHQNHVEALHGLAKALVYTGDGARARELLQRTKKIERGFVSPWRNNLLAVEELLEEEYVTLRAEGFEVAVHQDEVAVLEAYLMPWLLDARRVLTKKYGVSPEAKTVRVEVLSTWDDFSVRTIGFPGLHRTRSVLRSVDHLGFTGRR